VTGLHLSALGLGAWATRHVETRVAERLVHCQLGASLFGGLSVAMLFLAAGHPRWVEASLYALVLVTGALLGAETPLVLRLLRRRVKVSELLARVMAVEYLGALVGAVVLAMAVLPHLASMRAAIVFGLLHAASAWLAARVFAADLEDAHSARARSLAVMAVLGVAWLLSFRLTRAADQEISGDEVIFVQQTSYQRVVVTRGHGGVNLFLDGNLQFASVDEYRYHEALVHPAMSQAPRRTRVLVLGGGDGLAVREILRYGDVGEVTLVDLDPGITGLARTAPWLRALNERSLDAPRVRVVNDDAMVWLERERVGPFDVAIVDFPDPNNHSLGKLYTSRFYRILRARLRDDAVIAVQATSPLAARRSYWCVARTMASTGLHVRPYHALVPSFGEWGYVLASPTVLSEGLRRLPAGLRYVTEAQWQAMTYFAPDMAPVDVELNRLNDQVLVRYYEEEWRRWTR
jgi:spermidine synthase